MDDTAPAPPTALLEGDPPAGPSAPSESVVRPVATPPAAKRGRPTKAEQQSRAQQALEKLEADRAARRARIAPRTSPAPSPSSAQHPANAPDIQKPVTPEQKKTKLSAEDKARERKRIGTERLDWQGLIGSQFAPIVGLVGQLKGMDLNRFTVSTVVWKPDGDMGVVHAPMPEAFSIITSQAIAASVHESSALTNPYSVPVIAALGFVAQCTTIYLLHKLGLSVDQIAGLGAEAARLAQQASTEAAHANASTVPEPPPAPVVPS